MAFNRKVERFVSGWQPKMEDLLTNTAQQQNARDNARIQTRRWQVLLGCFALVFVVGQIGVWCQPQIYQSQAIIHFSYPQQTTREAGQLLSSVPLEQINLNRHRLTSFAMLQVLSGELGRAENIHLSPADLSQMLRAEAITDSRIINLYAKGQQPQQLAPVLASWLSLYLAQYEAEKNRNTFADIHLLQAKLASLEERILVQQRAMEDYAQQNNIVSLQRTENRTLSSSTNLYDALDQAQQEETAAQAAVVIAKEVEASGEPLISEVDITDVNQLRLQIAELEGQLSALAARYTKEYMQRDPDIVTDMQRLNALRQQLQDLLRESQQRYRQNAELRLAKASENRRILQARVTQVERQAQAFDQTLSEYQRMNDERAQLELRAQAARNELIEKQVEKPFEARVSILEQPFVPDRPIGPNYWLHSLLVLLLAVLSGLLMLFIYSFIVRQKPQAAHFSQVTLMPGAAPPNHQHQQLAQPHSLQPPLAGLPSHKQLEAIDYLPTRVLSEAECKQLFTHANQQGRAATILLLNGVHPGELSNVEYSMFNFEEACLDLCHPEKRRVPLADKESAWFQSEGQKNASLWRQPMDMQVLDQLIINAAHDGKLAFAEELNAAVLRHTFLTHLVRQGVKINDLEARAGYISPTELARYRQVNGGGESLADPMLASSFQLMS